MSAPAEELIATRESTHGDYKLATTFLDALAVLTETAPSRKRLLPAQVHNLYLILTKIARILHGNPYEADHWKGIADYALLAIPGSAPEGTKPSEEERDNELAEARRELHASEEQRDTANREIDELTESLRICRVRLEKYQ